MAAIGSSTGSNPLAELGLAMKQAGAGKQQLGQADFLKLMTTQMQSQDPFKPLDSTQFLGQIAQFSTVSGIQSLNEGFSTLASSLQSNQALQAAQLVGHGVLVPSDEAYLFEGHGLGGAADVPSSGQVSVEIRDAGGALLRTLDLGTQPAGLAQFSWDGKDSAGNALAAGTYRMSARVQDGSGSTAADTYAVALVNSVSVGSDGLNLNLQGMDPAAFSAVRQIY